MSGNEQQIISIILMTGGLLIVTMLVKLLFERIYIPPVVGFLLLGFLVRVGDSKWAFLQPESYEILSFLGHIGIITLLFKAGLNSDLKGLIAQLRRASIVWIINIIFSGAAGFVVAFYLLKLNMVTCLIVATAFTATSVGVSLAVWQDAGATTSKNGELLLDVAELDDISAIVLMALLFALLPLMHHGQVENGLMQIGIATGVFCLKIAAFCLLCYLFASFAEHPVVHFFRSLDPPPVPMLTIMGIGLVIAGFAGFLGFSLAIGAFFAGLVFSKDHDAVKMEASFLPLYQFFTPFFFIDIGLDISPESLHGVALMGGILFLTAVAGKLAANFLPVWLMKDLPAGLLIGFSMIPRAEISMIIMQRGLQLGDWAVPPEVFGAMAMVTILTCISSPLAVKILLKKWPQKGTGNY